MDTPDFTRRGFFSALGASAAVSAGAAAVAGRTASAAPINADLAGRNFPVTELSLQTFAPLVGQSFSVAHEEHGAVALKLMAAEESPAKFQKDQAGNAVMRGFSLVFEGPADKPLDQGIHTFCHPAVGECGLFAVPILNRNPKTRCYEVIFNTFI